MPDFLLQLSSREIIEVVTNGRYRPDANGNGNSGLEEMYIPNKPVNRSDSFIPGKRTIYNVGIPF
jgi:hypothetical protein